MSRDPYGWLDIMDPDQPMSFLAGDPYAPRGQPVALIHPAAEEEPEEEPFEEEFEEEPEEEPFEEEEEYQPYGSDHEDILDDAQSDNDPPEESLTDTEIISPPQSPLRTSPPPLQDRGKGPMLSQTARMSVIPRPSSDVFYFPAQPRAGPTRGPTHERGEPSRTPQARNPTPPPGNFAHAAGAIEQRVAELEEEQHEIHQAVQVLYHRAGASRTEAITQEVRLREMEYRLHITESRLDHAEHRTRVVEAEYRRLHELHHELLRHMNARFEL